MHGSSTDRLRGFVATQPNERWSCSDALPEQMRAATELGAPLNVRHIRSGIVLRLIPTGDYLMGAAESDPDAEPCERPAHRVRIETFYAAVTPLTWDQWSRVVPDALFGPPPPSPSADIAVDGVSFHDAQQFFNRTVSGLRLLTEAEWEYATRGGTLTRYWWGDDYRSDCTSAAPDPDNPLVVGQRPANPFGLFDVLGGVWEWCEDSWHDTYDGAPVDGSPWVDASPRARVLRGGMWSDFFELSAFLRSSCRYAAPPNESRAGHGFRAAVSVATVLDHLRPGTAV